MVFAHFASGVSDQRMPILQRHEETGVGHDFSHYALHLKKFFFGHFFAFPKKQKGLANAKPLQKAGARNTPS